MCCSQCDKVSVTFDPMMTISLPIPAGKAVKEFFFVPYSLQRDYVNKRCTVELSAQDNLKTFREEV